MKKKLFFSIYLIFIGNYLFAQATGDYRSVAGGNWNTLATWQRYNGTTFVAATSYPGQNTGTGVVTIVNGHVVTQNVSPANTIGSLVIQAGGTQTALLISNGFTLNVTGGVQINAPTSGTGISKLLVISGGTAQLNCASITLSEVGGTDNTNQNVLNLTNGGVVNVTGDITMSTAQPQRSGVIFQGTGGVLNIGGKIVGGTINPGTGTINFNGTGTQTIGGPRTLYNLGMTNAASTLQLNGNVTVSNALALTAGKINTQVNTLILSNATPANQLTGGSSSSYVYSTGAGRLQRNGLAAATSYNFPVGTSTNYMPVTVTPTTVSNFAVNVFSPASSNGIQGGPAFTNKSRIVDAGWNIGRLSGTGNSTITIQWVDALEGSSFAGYSNTQIGVSHYVGSWQPAIANNANAAANTVTATFNTFSPFGVGQIGIALPVELTDLSASRCGNSICLYWTTASENNNDHFEIERSADGKQFHSIGSVNGNGTTSDPHNYTFRDDHPLNGKNYYRIKQVDIDGRFSYSSVIRINNTSVTAFNASITPNPAASVMNLIIEGVTEKENLVLEVMNTNGMIVYRENISAGGTTIVKSLPRPAISAGVYFYKITRSSSDETFSGKLVLQ